MLSLQNVKKIYFIGIGGIGMSAVAGIAAHRGFQVSGSDSLSLYPPSKTVLDQYSISYHKGYRASHIVKEKPDLAVVGGGEGSDNPEVQAVLKEHIVMTSFPELLQALVREKQRIVICGTHGKTTTTALVALILQKCGKLPGYFIGGLVQDLSTNFHYTKGKYFVIEGDEYFSSFFDREPKFLYYEPNVLVIHNIEMDHFDFFDSREQLLAVFERLLASLPASGVVIANADDENVRKVMESWKRNVIWYSTENPETEWHAGFRGYEEEKMHFEVFHHGQLFSRFVFTKPGEHYMKNALAAIATTQTLGCDAKKMFSVLSSFQGPKRRFEKIGDVSGVMIIDDYAHHPTAVMQTLDAAKKLYTDRRIIAVYEPHTYTRTKHSLPQLEGAFFSADEVILTDIYPAREQHLRGLITAKEVVSAVKRKHQHVVYFPTQKEVLSHLSSSLQKKDVVIIMAVGAFHEMAYDLLRVLKRGKKV